MRKHRDAVVRARPALCAATPTWSRPRSAPGTTRSTAGERNGYRNAQATVLAPTGTISFLMDCDTTGIEPDFSLVKFKELVGGGQMTIVNRTVPPALRTLGYSDHDVEQIEAYLAEHGTSSAPPGCATSTMSVFDVAVGERAISAMGHVKMMAAAQPFISGAISKTVNLPESVTVEDVAEVYMRGLEAGPEGAGHLPRRLEDRAGAAHGQQEGRGRGAGAGGGRQAHPQADAARAPVAHAQVLDRRTRGLHHGRHVRGRLGRARSSSPTSARKARRCGA